MPIPKPKAEATAEGSTLAALRERHKWTQQDLADASGRSRTGIALLESGARKLKPKLLYELTAFMGYIRAEVDAVLYAMRVLDAIPEAERRASGISREEAKELRARACRLAFASALEFEETSLAEVRALRFAEAKQRVGEVGRELRALTGAEKRAFLEAQPVPMLYALIEWLCDESRRQAASSPFESATPAKAAVLVCDFLPCARSGAYSRAWALAFVGNALRASSNLPEANSIFEESNQLLHDAGACREIPLPLWRPRDLEASLRRDQRRWPEARALHEAAFVAAPSEERAALLLNYSSSLEQEGLFHDAVEKLLEAKPLVDLRREPRLVLAQRFNLAVNLVHIGEVSKAEEMLPEIRELSVGLRSELDVIRVSWLAGRIEGAMGRQAPALSALKQVRQYFAQMGLACDAADVALEEALLHLEGGDYLGAKVIAEEISWVFRAQGMHQDALSAVQVFCQAAKVLAATADLVRDLLHAVHYAPRLPLSK